jgi:hypothetical protein
MSIAATKVKTDMKMISVKMGNFPAVLVAVGLELLVLLGVRLVVVEPLVVAELRG